MQDHRWIDDLRRRVDSDPASIAFAQLAEEYRRAGRHQEAVDVCRGGLTRHPGHLSAQVTLGRALTALGLAASWTWDLPTGPAIVAAFEAACAFVAVGFGLWRLTWRRAAMFVCAVVGGAGFLLAAFPALDQPWLDALEDVAPPVQTAFLTESERTTRQEVLDSIARGRAELTRLRRLDQDVRWGAVAMEPERVTASRSSVRSESGSSAGSASIACGRCSGGTRRPVISRTSSAARLYTSAAWFVSV